MLYKNKSVIYTIDLCTLEGDVNDYINYIETELKTIFNITFIGNDQYELKISLSNLLSEEEEELLFTKIYNFKKLN